MAEKEDIIDIEDLPDVIPVFPLPNIILLPRSTLPLNIFEPRYIKMIRDAMLTHKLIGMVQPVSGDLEDDIPDLYVNGGVGRIKELVETEDGRLEITLRGVSRFAISHELETTTPYRLTKVDWQPYSGDLAFPDHNLDIGRSELLDNLSEYLKMRGLNGDYTGIEGAPDEVLVNTLSMIIPFEAAEKQALLEATDVQMRASTLKSLLGMAIVNIVGQADNDVH